VNRAAARALRHPALGGGPARPLAEARLSDRQRLAILFQGAALLAHLDHAGWRLTDGWKGAGLSADGGLQVAARPGRSRALPQGELRKLCAALFGGDGRPAGRGEARCAVRELVALWDQDLTPVSADGCVGRILDRVPFLWEEAFAVARRALVAEHEWPDGVELWVAGPGRCRTRVLGRGQEAESVAALLAGPDAREIWDGPPSGGCRPRWSETVQRFRRRPPVGREPALEFARALSALGRFQEALAALPRAGDPDADLLRAHCQRELGDLGAAQESLRRLAQRELDDRQVVAAAEVAVRVFAHTGQIGQGRRWLERALAVRDPGIQPLAHLLAARASLGWRDGELASRELEAVGSLGDTPALAWRWHQAQGHLALLRGDPDAAAHFGRALALGRRVQTRVEAGEAWSNLVVARVGGGDLAGAERACLHAARLFAGCDGARRASLALYNLADVRLRRGRTAGVREILERSTAASRLSGHHRGLVYDLELWARYELVHARPLAALERLREACAELRPDDPAAATRRAELALLEARALGWLERRADAARALAMAGGAGQSSLEPEERPALHALAGDPQEALASAAGTAFEPLWRGALTAETVDDEAWQSLWALEPYRAARLVHDLELARPGLVPVYWRRTAAATLRQVGAAAFADRVEDREQRGWAALERHLRGDGEPGLGQLFAAAGYPEARLAWRSGDEERTLVEGSGGEEELTSSWGGGELLLQAPLLDAPLRALFAVVLREPPPATAVPSGAATGLVGDSPALRLALRRADRLATGDLPVLVHGETGTGKELVARRVHAASRRAGGPFLPVNCAALSETLLLSDLFGHVRGAFTGADRDRTGVFESARGGTVFLDEVGDLPLHAQGVLLRVLQEREVRRLGESHARRVDVRVIAATHRDLGRRVSEGAFRQDLYYRLRVGHVRLPPLRERGDDVLRLAAHFLARRAGPAPRLSAAARGELARHSWPGNVRELENVLEVAAALAEEGEIHPEHLDLAGAARPLEAAAGDYHQRVEDFRRRLVEEALAAAGGRRAEAARKLGLTRQALSYLVRQLGIVTAR